MEDIQVRFSGTRGGEKLTEKLFFDHEKSVPTKSRQIHTAQLENGRRLDVDELLHTLSLLMRTAADEKDLALRFMSLLVSLDSPESDADAVETIAPRAAKGQVVPLRQMVAAGEG